MPVPHDIAAETELWNSYAESAFDPAAEPVFRWTQYKDHGPGPELLGTPSTALEIGCGTGRAAAYLALHGVQTTGLDLSPVMVKKLTERWSSTNATFVQGEVLEHLAATEDTYDAIYSIFGCAWFADPGRLFPLVRARLNPGGVFAFSQPPAIPGAYGPQGMYKGGFAGPAMFTYRYSFRPAVWKRLLLRAGFETAEAEILGPRDPGHIGTLLVTAHA
ncbi:methyltransferase type 11 [Streptomyces qinglanensis]|uniref:Methyltransferase type 11 n=1 Tax=Streptomyces qinglanensis TaxID=943816 RepID=A0A1E7KDG9_9ACTN|nr:class I SAM-dependent methyltransferase [Streptomyces qinglanensis]OEV01968.1 methyltransferase type 11 [Streptomyces qinglanensis]OEV27389.1 methyltransferase type 11 [Streptomyces nanshensis]